MGLKIPPYKISEHRNNESGFYDLLGPYLSRREVVAELGVPVWDDDDKVWYVAMVEWGDVLGFVAVRGGAVQSFYVIPDARGEAVGAALMFHLLGQHAGKLRATATPASLPLFKSFGFVEAGQNGRYTKLERPVDAVG